MFVPLVYKFPVPDFEKPEIITNNTTTNTTNNTITNINETNTNITNIKNETNTTNIKNVSNVSNSYTTQNQTYNDIRNITNKITNTNITNYTYDDKLMVAKLSGVSDQISQLDNNMTTAMSQHYDILTSTNQNTTKMTGQLSSIQSDISSIANVYATRINVLQDENIKMRSTLSSYNNNPAPVFTSNLSTPSIFRVQTETTTLWPLLFIPLLLL